MAYITAQQWRDRFGEDEFTQLTRDEVSVFNGAVADADAMIDAHLATRYALPLSNVPALLVGLSGDLSRYALYDESPPDVVTKRRDAAIEVLKSIASGDLAIPGAQSGSEASGPVMFASYSATRLFTQDTLAEFVWRPV
jgi:phage gp36-like protein